MRMRCRAGPKFESGQKFNSTEFLNAIPSFEFIFCEFPLGAPHSNFYFSNLPLLLLIRIPVFRIANRCLLDSNFRFEFLKFESKILIFEKFGFSFDGLWADTSPFFWGYFALTPIVVCSIYYLVLTVWWNHWSALYTTRRNIPCIPLV